MTTHRLTWQERIPRAFAEARSLKGDEIRPKDVVNILAKELPSVKRRHITDNVTKYVRRGPDGVYGITESQGLAIRWASPSLPPVLRGTTSSPAPRPLAPTDGQSSQSNPTLVPAQIMQELQRVRRTSFWRKMVREGEFLEALGVK